MLAALRPAQLLMDMAGLAHEPTSGRAPQPNVTSHFTYVSPSQLHVLMQQLSLAKSLLSYPCLNLPLLAAEIVVGSWLTYHPALLGSACCCGQRADTSMHATALTAASGVAA